MNKTLLLLSALISLTGFAQASRSNAELLANKAKPIELQNVASATSSDDPPVPPPLNPYFTINIAINNAFTRQLGMSFHLDATDGVDQDFDIKYTGIMRPNDVFFTIANENYIFQGCQYYAGIEIPLSVKVSVHSTLKFFISEIEAFDQAESIFIYDSLDKSYHDIKSGFYEVSVAPGTDSERFKIVFTKNAVSLPHDVHARLLIYQDTTHQHITVLNPDNADITSFTLYDLQGRAVIKKDYLGTQKNPIISTAGLSVGLYIAVFITSDNLKAVHKILISTGK
ncbi:T9SS type A sorting domain-containing protein [Flavobacterium olei]|uniref:T9SS type A sorting domain-containing protein n=1 Tax=Flavobacterium olei TaxID=1886782 RepID=UPI00321BFBB3